MEIDYDYLRTGTAIGFRAFRELCSNFLYDLSPFVLATFVKRIRDFPCGVVSVKVSVMEFGLYPETWGRQGCM